MPIAVPAIVSHFLRQLAGALLLGLLLGLIGPFGTFRELPLGDRLAYWIAIAVLNWLQIHGMVALLSHWSRADRLHAFVIGALAGVIAAVPATFEVAWLEQYFRPVPVVAPVLPLLYLQVAALSIAIAGPLTMLKRRHDTIGEATENPPAAPPAPARPANFMRRVPPGLGGQLLALEMEDHYLRIHTDRGSDLILCRFADALAELDGSAGLRVHRSWWVARAAVAAIRRREDGKLILQLSNGLEVPVSRSYDKTLREAGWLAMPIRGAAARMAETSR